MNFVGEVAGLGWDDGTTSRSFSYLYYLLLQKLQCNGDS
jgi:hypothetical protein